MNIVLDFRPALRHSTGVGTYCYNLAAALSAAFPQDSYTAFSASWKDRMQDASIPEGVRAADWKIPVGALDWAWPRWNWPPIERFVGKVDIAHSPYPMLLPSHSGRRVVTVHDCYFMRHPEDVSGTVRRDYVPLARQATQRADAVVVNSESTAREAQELLGIAPDKICITHLGVRESFFGATPDDARATLEEHGIDRPFVLFVGRREKRKDLGTLQKAFAELTARDDNIQLLLVGPDGDGWDETWADTPDVVRHLTRLILYQDVDVLRALYAAASVAVLPSRWEGFGLTGLEAMAAGTPVVATDAGALPEIFGNAALYAPPGDAPALAHQCRRLIEDSELARRQRARGLARAREFPWSATAQRTHELYTRLTQ